jgi:hypothetical protein
VDSSSTILRRNWVLFRFVAGFDLGVFLSGLHEVFVTCFVSLEMEISLIITSFSFGFVVMVM